MRAPAIRWNDVSGEVSVLRLFNVADVVDPEAYFRWLSKTVWASTAKFGCVTQAFRVDLCGRHFATIARWPSATARSEWERSERDSLSLFPGTTSPWQVQSDMIGGPLESLEVHGNRSVETPRSGPSVGTLHCMIYG